MSEFTLGFASVFAVYASAFNLRALGAATAFFIVCAVCLACSVMIFKIVGKK